MTKFSQIEEGFLGCYEPEKLQFLKALGLLRFKSFFNLSALYVLYLPP
jgi:hypothetical protein